MLYLLHGAGDSDDSWTSVGRANFILDNLIAAGGFDPVFKESPGGHTWINWQIYLHEFAPQAFR